MSMLNFLTERVLDNTAELETVQMGNAQMRLKLYWHEILENSLVTYATVVYS
jgi:hypothetical protein